MKKNSVYFFTCLLSIFFVSCEQKKFDKSYCLQDDIAAIKLAEVEWFSAYGKSIYQNQPFMAEIKNDSIWIVKGTLHFDTGGVPLIEINARNCEVLKMMHGK